MTGTALIRLPAGAFFALAGLCAAALPWVWLLPVDDPRLLHLRLGFFGFAGTAATGYLLTAQQGWTGGAALPAPLLAALTLGARLAALLWPDRLAPVALPQLLVAGALVWPVVAARQWARLPLALVPLALTLAEAAIVGDYWPSGPALLPRAVLLLILLIGGRALPRFGRVEAQRRGESAAAVQPVLPVVTLALAGMLAPGWIGAGLVLAVALWVARQAGRELRHGAAQRMLALAYLGLLPALTGLAALAIDAASLTGAIHLATLGAMGPMILAYASRPAMLRPPGAALRPLRRHWAALALLALALPLRLAGDGLAPLVLVSGLCWSGAWGLFLSAHLPALARPAPFPLLSARRG